MRSRFPLFQSHLDLAHSYWEKFVQTGDHVIDATCGNGQDTLFLAKLCLNESSGELYAIDILPKAVELTKKNLENSLTSSLLSRIHYIPGCHSTFPEEILPESVKLVVYNLGYLPGGGDKTKTTKVETTLQSLQHALELVQKGGMISLTLYPGHPEGEREESHILTFIKNLDPLKWNCCHHQWLNRHKSPSLLLLQKNL